MSSDGRKGGRRSPFALPAFLRGHEAADPASGLVAAAPGAGGAADGKRAWGASDDGGVTGDMIWNEDIATTLGYGKG